MLRIQVHQIRGSGLQTIAPGQVTEEQLSAGKQARFVRKAQVHQVHLRCELSLEKTGLSYGGGASK